MKDAGLFTVEGEQSNVVLLGRESRLASLFRLFLTAACLNSPIYI